MNKIHCIVRVFLVTVLLLSGVNTAQAAPPTPSHFYGEIHVLDNPPVVGSTIQAYVPGVVAAVGTAPVTQDGSNLVYSIDVLGDDPDITGKDGGLNGDLITFRFGTRILGTRYFESGSDNPANFHPPQAIPGGPYAGNEGSAITFAGSAADWGTDIATYAWDMDSDPLTFEITGVNPIITFPSSGVFTVRLRVTDNWSGEGITPVSVTVNNVAPTVTAYSPSVAVNEGTQATNAGTVSDPGNDAVTFSASVGTAANHGDGTWGWSYTPTDGPAQSQIVTITATDADGGIGTTTFNLVVNNVGPIGTLGNNGPVLEGSPANISFSGPADASSLDTAAGFHYAFSCTNGSLAGATYANSPATPSTPCTFPDGPGAYDVRARIIDKDDGYSEYTTNVIVGNVAPTVTVNQTLVTVDEGQTAVNSGTFSDPSTDIVTLSTSAGTVVNNGNGTWSWSFLAASGPGDSGNIVITAVDDDGGSGGVLFALEVNNVAPTADAGGPYEVFEGQPVNFIGTATDPGLDDNISQFDYYWDYDYISPTFTYDASGSATVSPTYSDEGVYVAAFRVEDAQFAVGLDTTTVTILNTPPTNVSPGGPYYALLNNILNMTGTATCASVDICTYAWDLDNDGQFDDGTGPIASYTWTVEGVYTIRLQVTDDDGSSAVGTTTVTVSTVVTHSIPLAAGWNLISFNVHPADTATGAVLADIAGHFTLVYGWDASGTTAGNWLLYDAAVPFLADLTNLSELQGYWIFMTQADTLDVIGTPLPTSSIPLYDNAGGWNLVGYPSITNRDLPGAIPAAVNEIYAYHPLDSLDPWKLYDRDYPIPELNDLTVMSPGWGYWMLVTTDATWNVGY